jgi:HD-GYP domain-containing protein (c-di-GMP phosphodiesterase class II)
MDYTPLRISTIKPERQITFDLYIHFKEQFLKYVENGRALQQDHLQKLRKQKIAKFYITSADELNYQTFLDTLLSDAINDDSMCVEEKCDIAEGAASTSIEKMQKDPGSKVAYKMTEKAANSLRQIVSKNPDALKKIFGKKAHGSDLIIKHSLNVSAISTKLAERLKCTEQELDDLATAGLVHDIGCTKLAKDDAHLFEKRKKLYTPDEKRIMNFHPKDGAALLADKKYINDQIKELVINHEEVLSGAGPQKKTKLTKLEEILSLVNAFDMRVTVYGISPKDAIQEMSIDELGNYSLDNLNLLKQVVKEEGLLTAFDEE